MMHLIVMYHYIWPDGEVVPGGIRPMMASEFEAQLDYLESRYDILPAGEFLRAVRSPDARPACLLTFDDATADHATVATPILARRNLSGVFFVISGPAETGFFPLTHALHWLLSKDEGEVWDVLAAYARAKLGGEGALGDEGEARRIYHYESPLRARIKYAANMALSPGDTRAILHDAIAAAGQTPEGLAARWFASVDQLRAMHHAGMTLGVHGVTHQSLQTLGPEGISREIDHCVRFLQGITGQRPTWFACPFGGSGGAPEAVAAMHGAMKAAGIEAAVTTRAAEVTPNSDPLQLPRIDCIHLPPRVSR